MASDRGISSQLEPSELDPTWVRGSNVLHVSGYCLLREPMAEAAIEAARQAERVSVASRLRALNPDLIFATETERAAIPDFDADWVIKLGAAGARFPEGHYGAHTVEPVDTTGAGDALAAGYLVGGPDLAMKAAAASVASIGAMPSHASGLRP